MFGRKKRNRPLETKVIDQRGILLETLPDKKARRTYTDELVALGQTGSAPTVFLIRFDTRGKDARGKKEDAFAKLQADVTAAIINGTPGDHVYVSIFSPGGPAYEYANAAQQIQRLRDARLRVIGFVDEVAASGGYMMACACDELRANPFAYVGSIGVVGQVPIVADALGRIGVTFRVYTQGEMKRTVTPFKQPTDTEESELRRKMGEVHDAFKGHVRRYRPQVRDEQMNGEVWLGQQVVGSLVDAIGDHNTAMVAAFRAGSPIYSIHTDAPMPFTMKRFLGFDTMLDDIVDRLVNRVTERLQMSGYF